MKYLQKVFHGLHHKVPVEEMTFLGFKISVIKWFKSYLLNYKFFASVDVVSQKLAILTGAPQGSKITSVLYIDLPQSLQVTVVIFILIILVFSMKAETYKNEEFLNEKLLTIW